MYMYIAKYIYIKKIETNMSLSKKVKLLNRNKKQTN